MAAYVPPPSPGTLRTPRDRALEIGTMRSGFEAPMAPDISMPMATPTPAGGPFSYEGGALNPATPFNIKK